MVEENGKSSRRRTRSRCVCESRGGRARVGLIDGRRSGQSVLTQMPQLPLVFGVLGGLKIDSNACGVRASSSQSSDGGCSGRSLQEGCWDGKRGGDRCSPCLMV